MSLKGVCGWRWWVVGGWLESEFIDCHWLELSLGQAEQYTISIDIINMALYNIATMVNIISCRHEIHICTSDQIYVI